MSELKGKISKNSVVGHFFQWILDTLLQVDEINQVVINTDATEILSKHDVINDKRLYLREKKDDLCGDLVSMNRIIADDIANVKSDLYLMTHTTNPLISVITIKRAIKAFLKNRERRKY